MFFKNIILYQMVVPFALEADELNICLQKDAYMPCSRSENASYGWVSPYESNNTLFVHSLKDYYLVAFCKEEKILPSSVIKDELNKKITILEQREDRTIYHKEKKSLREEVIINLRQQAFSRKKIIHAYIDKKQNWLIVDTSNKNKAEEICSHLRKSLGSLKLALPATIKQPENTMTSWILNKKEPPYFNIENNCDMLDPKQKMSMIKCQEQDLNADEIIGHLSRGKQIVKLALNWQEKISFEFNDDLRIRKIKFLNLIQERRSEKHKSHQEQLDTHFAIMTGEFSLFLPDLWALFDGLKPLENGTI